VIAGPMFWLAQHFGYRLAYLMATGLCLAGLLLLVLVRNTGATRYRGSGARAGRTDAPAGDRRPA
jgi:SET family sugar efflux transporter-like MFS transporter